MLRDVILTLRVLTPEAEGRDPPVIIRFILVRQCAVVVVCVHHRLPELARGVGVWLVERAHEPRAYRLQQVVPCLGPLAEVWDRLEPALQALPVGLFAQKCD